MNKTRQMKALSHSKVPESPGPSCSKLKMLIVNGLLKLLSLNMAYMLIFLLKKNVSSFCKSYSLFSAKIPVN